MSTAFDDLSPYEQQMRQAECAARLQAAEDCLRPSMQLRLAPVKCVSDARWRVTHGGVEGEGNTPEQAMRAFDAAWTRADGQYQIDRDQG